MSETVPRSAGPVTRFWQRHPWLADGLIGLTWVVFTAFGPLVTVSSPAGTSEPSGSVLPAIPYIVSVVVAAGGIIAFRRRRPTLAFLVVFVATLPLVLVDPSLSNLAVAYAVFAVAVYDSPRRAWMFAAPSALLTIGVAVLSVFVPLPFVAEPLESPWASAATYMIVGILTLLVALFWVAVWELTVETRKRVKGFVDDLALTPQKARARTPGDAGPIVVVPPPIGGTDERSR